MKDLKKEYEVKKTEVIKEYFQFSDEYKNLPGAPKHVEGNPMLGNHGIRFSIKNPEIMVAELIAIKQLALKYNDREFGVMMPQVISLEEVEETKKSMEYLKMPENVKLGIMVETPAAVQIINQLCESGIKFVSFGTNDLTQYMLAIDRNNEEIQDLYNEMHPAVLSALSYVIRRCKKYGVETSICGQAGSKEDMVRFLINEGIDSISVNADAAENVSIIISGIESEKIPPQTQEINIQEEIANGEIEAKEEKKDEEIKVHKNEAVMEKVMKQDIEEVILKELETEDYSPGGMQKDNDIPNLNDAIPVDSEQEEY